MKKEPLLLLPLFLLIGCSGDDGTEGPASDGLIFFDSDTAAVSDHTATDESLVDDPATDETFPDNAPLDDPALPDDTAIDDIPVDDTPLPDEDPVDETIVPDDTVPQNDCEIDDAHRYACCVFEQVNLFRSQAGLGLIDYVYDAKLAEVGFYYAGYMADHNSFAHSADGINFGQRLDNFGVAWASAGENLQRNTRSSWEQACQETVWGSGGWANSTQGHREAMLGQAANGTPKGWTHAGAGVAKSGVYWYVAMYFVKY